MELTLTRLQATKENMKAMQQTVLNGLKTDMHKIVTAGNYSITTRTTMVQPSALVVTITQSGSQSVTYTSAPTSPQSGDTQVTGKFNCAAGDLITVAVTSSANADQPPSLVKTTIDLRQGV
jgi:hypothetical protein